METKICKCCGLELPLESFYKSKNVKGGYENKCKKCRNKDRLKYKCTCIICGKEWMAQKKDSLYCSSECKPQSKSKRVKCNCTYCGKEIEVTPYKIEKFEFHYCSIACKNKHYSSTHKGINSKKFSKIECKCYICGKTFFKTKSQKEKYKHDFCSKECKSEGFKILLTGSNNPNYNPLRSEEERVIKRNIPGYKEFVRRVFERDNYSCRCCGDNKGHNLNAHHIINYSENEELRTDENNGITLCETCHTSFHMLYGYKHNNKKQIYEFISKHGNTEPSL